VPLGLLAGIPALANEVIILGPEAQLAACFVLFCSTMYTQVGPMASKFFQDYQDNVAKDLRQVDENMLVEVKQNIESTTQLLDLEKDLTAITNLRDDLAVVQADVLNHMEQHKFRDAIARKLDSLVAIEEAATVAIRKRMVNKVKEEVVSSFTNDRKAKDKALDSAIAVLSAGVGAKRGKDVVGEAFVKSIAQYREDYAKKPASEDPLIVQFEKDVAAVAMAPLVTFQATNVYVSHPLQGAAPASAGKKH
jgi:F0F1-type ATP synthase membrane subunit b/b'